MNIQYITQKSKFLDHEIKPRKYHEAHHIIHL
jgi:hypothetical protein